MTIPVKIDDDLEDRMLQLAASRRQSPDGMVREAIQQYIQREEGRESFRDEALTSWNEYNETGLHLTGDELKAWLRDWGTEAETEPPDCHK